MPNYRIKLERLDEKLTAGVKTVRLGDKKFNTPFKSFSKSGANGVVEVFSTFSEENLRKAYSGKSNLDRIPRLCKQNSVNLIVPSYADTKITDREMSIMENRIHPHTDAVIIPRWDGILSNDSDSKLAEDLCDVTNRYIEEVRRINGKLIIGNIPLNKSQSVVDALLKNYLERGITSFVLDYGRCQVLSKAHFPRNIMKKLEEYTSDGDYLLYSMNMKKSHDRKNIKPADDFLTFANGFDIIGNFHLSAGGKVGTGKVFSPTDWTYREVPVSGTGYEDLKNWNERVMNAEAENVRDEILDSGTAMNLAKTKPGAYEYTRSLNQTTLDTCGLSWI